MQAQQQTLTTVSYQSTPQEIQKLRHIFNLGITEVVFGSLSFLSGIVLIFSSIQIFEGLWCGIFIILAGAFGIAAGRPNSTKCIVICHMVFAIIGSIFAGIMFILSIIYSFFPVTIIGLAFRVLLDLLAFLSLVLQIVSASYCCCVRGGCCAENNGNVTSQAVVVQQPVQGVAIQPGPGVVAYQQQPVFVAQQPQAHPNQQQQVFVQNEKAGGIPTDSNPPAYT